MEEIRQAEIEDYKAISEVSEGLGYMAVSQIIAEQRVAAIIRSDHDYLCVYEINNRIIGWLHMFNAMRVASAPFAEIGGLVVSKEYRRKGIGKKLVEHAMERAREMGLKVRVRSNTSRDGAHHFYESLGFKKTRTQHIYEYKHKAE